MKNTKYGNPLTEPDLEMGPLVSKQQLEQVEASVRQAQADGAEVVLGGKRADRGKGFYFEPTVLTNCRQELGYHAKGNLRPGIADRGLFRS